MSLTIQEFKELYIAANEGATQGDVADYLGCSRAYFNQMLNHKKRPGTDMMVQLYLRSGCLLDLPGWIRHAQAAPEQPAPADAGQIHGTNDSIEP